MQTYTKLFNNKKSIHKYKKYVKLDKKYRKVC